MSRSRRYPPEVRERAVALVLEHQGEYRSQWAAMEAIAPKFGMATETLRCLRSLRQQVVNALARKTGLRSNPSNRNPGLLRFLGVAP